MPFPTAPSMSLQMRPEALWCVRGGSGDVGNPVAAKGIAEASNMTATMVVQLRSNNNAEFQRRGLSDGQDGAYPESIGITTHFGRPQGR